MTLDASLPRAATANGGSSEAAVVAMEEEFEEREPQLPPPTRVQHIKKRALKNKSLAVSFDEKSLRDYVTGFHKRKKKRRKEAQKQQEEVLRRKRIEARKKRKQEREFALYGGAPPAGSEADDNEEPNRSDEDYHSDGEEGKPSAFVNATKTYDGTDIKVTVTTCEIFRENGADLIKKTQTTMPKSKEVDAKHNLAVSKKKSFKKISKHKVRAKPRNSKRDKNKGKKNGNKR